MNVGVRVWWTIVQNKLLLAGAGFCESGHTDPFPPTFSGAPVPSAANSPSARTWSSAGLPSFKVEGCFFSSHGQCSSKGK
jgi:hypothetical protein